MSVFRIAAFAGALALPLFFFGCETERPARIDIDELEKKMQMATDPDSKGAKATSYFERYALRDVGIFFDTVYRVEVRYKRPNKMRITTMEKNKPVSEIIINDGAAWIADYNKRTVKVLHGERLQRLRAFNHLSTPGMTFRKFFFRVDLSIDRIPGEEMEYYKLTCYPRLSGGSPLYVYIGMDDYLVKAIQATYVDEGVETSSFTRILEYAVKDGVRIPVEMEGEQAGMMTHTTVSIYTLNHPFDDDDFLPPLFPQDRGI